MVATASRKVRFTNFNVSFVLVRNKLIANLLECELDFFFHNTKFETLHTQLFLVFHDMSSLLF